MYLDAARSAACKHMPQVRPRRSIDSAARNATTAPSVRLRGRRPEAYASARVLLASRLTAEGGAPALINARFTMLSVPAGQL
jgi:hypothetical protein